MKVLRLDLRAFGPFTDVTLDLEAGNHGLHVIYGPNEAGKSATLRALRQFFYGIPERTTDAFQHPYEKLRIAAQVRHSDGSSLECIRRKARVNALRGMDDKAIIAPKDLARFLADVDQPLFETMFGIDHQDLVKGGQEIMRGGGHLGRVLFAAGSGIADLRAVQEGLQTEIGDLFRPAGRTQRVNKALTDLRETQVVSKRQQLSAEEWARHDRDLRAAEQQKQQVESERQQKSRELNRLTRIRDALPAIARRKEQLTEWAEYREAILLPPDFPEKRQNALETLRVAEDQARQSQLALEQIDQELHQLDVPEALLEQAEKIQELHKKLGEYQKNIKDRPQRVLQGKQLEHDAKEILKSLRRPADLAQAESLRLGEDEKVKIQSLGAQLQGLLTRRETAQQACTDLADRTARAREELGRLPVLPDPGELRRTIRLVHKEGALEEQLATERPKLPQAEKQAGIELARLTLWSGTLEALEQLAVPAPETVERFESDLKDVLNIRDNLRNQLGQEEQALRDLDGQIEELELEQEVPSEKDLHEARRQRDTGWRLVRRAWQEQREDAAEIPAFLANFEGARNLAEAYERCVERADQIADRLRREADRVLRKANLLAERSKRRDQRDRLAHEAEQAEAKLVQIQKEWAEVWELVAIQALPPREMRSWLHRQGQLTRQIQALRQQRDQVERLQKSRDLLRGQLAACLKQLGEPSGGSDATLNALLEHSQGVVDHFDNVQRQRELLQREAAGLEQELRGAEPRARQAEEELVRWRAQWAKAIARLGLDVEASPAEANAFVKAIDNLFHKLHEAEGFRKRIDGMDRDVEQFTADLQALVHRIAPDLASVEVARAVDELNIRLTRAHRAEQEQRTLRNKRRQETEKLRKAQEMVTGTTSRLAAMCRESGCSTHDELPRAEQRSARRQQLENEIRQREEHLLTLSAGATLDEFIADAARVDADSIEPEIQHLGKQISGLESAISRIDQTIGSERTLLAAMHDNAAASEAAEGAQNLLAQLQTDVEHYVTLRLAAAVLQEAIERYRKKNQGSVLARAGRLFADLTVGSFEGLQIDYDDAGEPILIGVRSGNREAVGVTGMSDGSCDQLYLALRLASLEAYLETHEPIPFIVDDILLNFDNDRALAALKALAELSRHTQVIFFTHHEHLVEMARGYLENDVLVTHRLPDGAPRTASQRQEQPKAS